MTIGAVTRPNAQDDEPVYEPAMLTWAQAKRERDAQQRELKQLLRCFSNGR